MDTAAETRRKMDAFIAELREDIRTQALHLPTLPDTAVQALFIINDPSSSIQDLAGIVARDTAIATRLVHYANSPLYRGEAPCNSIKAAITRLGMDKARAAIMALAMKDVFTSAHESIADRMEGLWSHSIEVAALSMILASRQPHLDPETALLAGLIHDIGVIPILNKAAETDFLTTDDAMLDRVISGLHNNLGKAILKVWSFDPEFIEVAGEHDNLARSPGDAPVDYTDIVTAANVESYAGTRHRLASVDRLTIPAYRRLGCTPASPDLDWENAEEAIQEVNLIFSS